MKKAILAAAAAVLAATSVQAGLWKGLDEANWYAGPKLTEADLANKVVLVYSFKESEEMMPRIEKLWGSFKTKPFVIVASHRGGRDAAGVSAIVAKNKFTMPVYEGFEYAFDAPGTSLYVVNHRGLLVWSGSEDRDATDAFVTAIGDVGQPPDLLRGVALTKARKSLKKKIVLGKSIKSELAKLEKEIKAYEKIRKPSAKATAKCEEARSILEAVNSNKDKVKAEIEALKKVNADEAAKLEKAYSVTFPEETAK